MAHVHADKEFTVDLSTTTHAYVDSEGILHYTRPDAGELEVLSAMDDDGNEISLGDFTRIVEDE